MFTEDYRPFYADFGVAATYLDRDGASVPCTVLVDRDVERLGDVAPVNARTAVLSVPRALVALAPRRGDRFTLTVGGEVLTVDNLLTSDELEHRVVVA